MIDRFKPTWMLSTIYNLSSTDLKEHGIKAVFSDMDNTLIAWNNPNGTQRLKRWNHELQAHQIKLVVISNNTHRRVARAVRGLSLDFISWALKPLPWGLRRALKRYHLKSKDVVMVGDQLLTDIWAANNCHIRSIWVKPLVATDSWNTRINRFFERRIKKMLIKKYKSLHWKENLHE